MRCIARVSAGHRSGQRREPGLCRGQRTWRWSELCAGDDPPRYLLLLNPDTLVRRGRADQLLVVFLDAAPARGHRRGRNSSMAMAPFSTAPFTFPRCAMALFDFWTLNHRLLDSRLNGRYPRALLRAGQPFPHRPSPGRRADDPPARLPSRWACSMTAISCTAKRSTGACARKRAGWEIYCVPQAAHHPLWQGRARASSASACSWRSGAAAYRLFDKHYTRRLIACWRGHRAGGPGRDAARGQRAHRAGRAHGGREAASAWRPITRSWEHVSMTPSHRVGGPGARQRGRDRRLPGQRRLGRRAHRHPGHAQQRPHGGAGRASAGPAWCRIALRTLPRSASSACRMPRGEWLFYVDTDERGTPALARDSPGCKR